MLDWLAQLLNINRRRSLREPRRQEAHLFAGVAPLGPVWLLDRSATGVRVEFVQPVTAERASHLLLIAGARLLDVSPVWTNASQAGFRITASCDLRGYTEGEADQIKMWWVAHRTTVG